MPSENGDEDHQDDQDPVQVDRHIEDRIIQTVLGALLEQVEVLEKQVDAEDLREIGGRRFIEKFCLKSHSRFKI